MKRMETEKRVHVEVEGRGTFTCDRLAGVADEMLRLQRLNEAAFAAAVLEDDGDVTVWPAVRR